LLFVPGLSRLVIAGLDPAIHDEVQRATSKRSYPLHRIMDARVKPAHDAQYVAAIEARLV